jgi:hypothetical protein
VNVSIFLGTIAGAARARAGDHRRRARFGRERSSTDVARRVKHDAIGIMRRRRRTVPGDTHMYRPDPARARVASRIARKAD